MDADYSRFLGRLVHTKQFLQQVQSWDRLHVTNVLAGTNSWKEVPEELRTQLEEAYQAVSGYLPAGKEHA